MEHAHIHSFASLALAINFSSKVLELFHQSNAFALHHRILEHSSPQLALSSSYIYYSSQPLIAFLPYSAEKHRAGLR